MATRKENDPTKQSTPTMAEEAPRSLITLLARKKEPMTVKQLAEYLRISKRSVYNAIEKDSLPVIRIGSTIRLDPVHVARWLRKRQVG
jgi:excisionase family DNA binding protein